jgi:hypothetical protein
MIRILAILLLALILAYALPDLDPFAFLWLSLSSR